MSVKQLDESKQGAYSQPSVRIPANTSAGRERILILGSGWAGFGLARSLDQKYYQPILITPRTNFVFTPLLAGTAVGTLEFRTAIESAYSIPGVRVIRAWAENIDVAHKTLTAEPVIERDDIVETRPASKFELQYDKLVIAVGCYSQTFGTPGVKEHAFFLKDMADARRIRLRILDLRLRHVGQRGEQEACRRSRLCWLWG